MKLKERMQNAVLALSDNRLVGRKKLAISYASLFLAFTFMLVTTMAWFTVKDTASINSQTFSLESSAALRVNDGEKDLSNHITVDNFKLEEASSVDGRNMFFPSEGNFKDSTSAMKFREGTAGDRNKTYVYKDFKLNADSDVTNIYVKSYNINIVSASGETLGKFDGSTEIIRNDKEVPIDQKVYDPSPLRIAFITDSSKTPTVIDPSALIDEHAKNYNAVSSTNAEGSPTTQLSSCKTFSDFYFYSGESLFSLIGQTPLDVTLVAWFEGAYDNQEIYNKYAGATVTIDIELESNWDDMEIVTFVDQTIGDQGAGNNDRWISSDDCIVTMEYDEGKKDTDGNPIKKTVVMMETTYNGEKAWKAALPKTVTTNISFYRFSKTSNIIFNSWHTKSGIMSELNPNINNDSWLWGGDLQDSRIVNGNSSLVYTAIRGNGYGKTESTSERLSPCVGYWDYSGSSSGGGGSSGGSLPTGTEIQTGVYLTVNKTWVRDNITKDGYTPYVVYEYDGKRTEYEMTPNDDASYLRAENKKAFVGSRILYFKFVNPSDKTYKIMNVTKVYVFEKGVNISFTTNDDDTASYH